MTRLLRDGTEGAKGQAPRDAEPEARGAEAAAAEEGTDLGFEGEREEGAGLRSEGESEEGAGPAAEGEPGEDGVSGRRRRPGVRVWRAAVAVLAVVLVLAGGGFFYGAHQLTSAASAQNRALTDTEATTRVAGDVGNGLARVFSYTPDGLDAAERSARSVLDGRAARQYTQLLGRIRAELAEQRVTLSTQAVRVGVIELDGHSARLLVFLDQVSRRGKAAPTSAAAQLTVTARREHDQWRIVDITTR